MNGINGGIGLWIAKERMQDLRRDADHARRARPIDGEQGSVERGARALIARPFRLLGAGR